jgi:hypothetical protein
MKQRFETRWDEWVANHRDKLMGDERLWRFFGFVQGGLAPDDQRLLMLAYDELLERRRFMRALQDAEDSAGS